MTLRAGMQRAVEQLEGFPVLVGVRSPSIRIGRRAGLSGPRPKDLMALRTAGWAVQKVPRAATSGGRAWGVRCCLARSGRCRRAWR
ncbi:MAG TPA: hypothetical protein VF598_14695 [Hymenobacter sp.]